MVVTTRSGSDSEADPTEVSRDTVGSESGQMAMWARLTDILERLAVPQEPAIPHFKAPRYNGTGDVEMFIQQFRDVIGANQWPDDAALLHLRQALEGDAKDCGRPTELEGVFNNLRARFGLTPREARTRLNNEKKGFQTTLQEHASNIQSLVDVAYANLPQTTRHDLYLECFQNSLGSASLQRHLLAIKPATLDEAVLAGNEYLQVQVRPTPPSTVHQVEKDAEAPPTKAAPLQPEPLTALMEAMTQLTKQVSQLQTLARPTAAKKGPVCWTCRQPGNLQRQCPSTQRPSGNDGSQR